MKKFVVATLVLILATNVCAAQSAFTSFVTRQGDILIDENGKLKFVSFNIPCLHYNEDNFQFEQTNPWRLTNEFEIADALEAVRRMGGKVVRTYTLSVRTIGEDANIPRHITGLNQFDEGAFKALDEVLAVANRKGIRVIIPFIDNWKWWGGIRACAAFRGKNKEDFWTDPELFEDYKKIVRFVINRTNTITGIKYCDDKAILAWETGNELTCPHEWTAKAAAYIKSIDKNHLVIDGYHTTTLRKESLQDENIDIVTTHHYSKNPKETVSQIKQNAAKTRGKKPYFVGEFGFVPTKDVQMILETIVNEDITGALIWSLRFRNRDGGFYWHSEPYGGDLFKAYHWPGFDSGSAYDETNLLKLMRQKAYEIDKLPVPALNRPAAAVLLNIDDAAAISWQGSAGAQNYIVERAQSPDGPWLIVGCNISDAAVQYRPLFNDVAAEMGKTYYYRIKAQNSAGISEASNVVGPVFVDYKTIVDELQDFRFIHKQSGDLSLESRQARRFKEDIHRLKGNKGSYIIYKVDAPINIWKVYSFFEDEISDFRFYVSDDGKYFKRIEFIRSDYFAGSGNYGYCKPVVYQGFGLTDKTKFLKVEYTSQAQVSRVEIKCGKELSKFKHTYSPTGFIKGFSWGWSGWKGQYLGSGPVDSMKKLADTGSNWVCISFGTEMEKPNEPPITWSDANPRMVSDDEILWSIKLACDNNLKVILKPVVNVRDGTWRAFINFKKEDGSVDEKAWDRWWSDFRLFILHYAKMAEQTNCEMICLGCEMISTERFESRWRSLIAEVRQVYCGVITYNANHGREDKVNWFDALDVISLSAYYPIGTDDVLLALEDDLSKVPPCDRSVEALKRRWKPIKEKLRKISQKFDRPILFVELGVCSAKGFSAAPWTHYQPNAQYDADEQRRYYQATIETFWDEPWFIGFTWWAWPPNLYSLEEAKGHTGFCVYGKPAEQLVRQWYSKER